MYDSVMLDVGGTFVKYGAMRQGQFCLKGQFPIREEGRPEEILQPILDFLTANPAPRVVICMPGPADYAMGVSQMTHKFKSIQGFPIKPWLEQRLEGARVFFLHDGVAFMLGEMTAGALRGADCAAGVMLGTGLGFGLCRRGRVLIRPAGTPAHPLWCAPWKGGICEDFVSGRALRKIWQARTGQRRDVHEIAALARSGDEAAAELFRQAGRTLGEMLRDHLSGWPVERVAVGGQIAKSWDLFAESYAEACPIPATAAGRLEDAALWGDYAYAQHGDDILAAN